MTKCSKCGDLHDGKSRYCRTCHAVYMRLWRRCNQLSESQRVKMNARSYANVYERRGLLKRLPCEVCGDEAEKHHTDYAKPLEVRWFCRLHHMEEHRKTFRKKVKCPTCGKRNKAPRRDYCRECYAAYYRNRRAAHPKTEDQRRREVARAYANVYQKRGVLKPLPCEVCGSTFSIEKQIDDPDNPLSVRWFCRAHRLQLRRKKNRDPH